MITNSIQLMSFVSLTLVAGLLMMLAGTQKRMLRWKPADRRCATCGRRKSAGCACRR
jgi:hypothetical protein